jgi:alkylation response protein AidB-like acyl-CoA dehydrogenase
MEREEILRRARTLGERFGARANAAERARRLPPETGRDLRASGLLRLAQPKSYGGLERDPDLLIEAIMEIAAGCASSAWVYGIAAGQQIIVANFPAAAQDDVWRDDPDAITCGAYLPQGEAAPAPGGFRLTGRWSFVSGCDIAQWALIGVTLPSAPAFALVPSRDWTALDDWETTGLAATGSKSIELQDAFVPSHRVLPAAAMTGLRGADAVPHAHPMYRLPMLSFVPFSLGAVALGAAKGAVAAFAAAARERSTRGGIGAGRSPLAGFAAIHMRIGEALAASDAAAALALQESRAMLASLRAGEELSRDRRIAVRRGQAFAVQLAVKAAEAIAPATGVAGLAVDHAVARACRDTVAVSRHIGLNWDAVSALAGRHALGLEVEGNF